MANSFPGYENVVTQITATHARIHQGLFFSGDVFDPALAAAGVINVLLRPDSTVSMHARFTIAAGGDSEVRLFEDTTFSAPGTAVLMSNRNRITTLTARGLVTSGPTITADGTQLIHGLSPGGKSGQSAGGIVESFEEWMLAPGKVYLLRVVNLAAQVQPVDIQVDMYEPIGKLR